MQNIVKKVLGSFLIAFFFAYIFTPFLSADVIDSKYPIHLSRPMTFSELTLKETVSTENIQKALTQKINLNEPELKGLTLTHPKDIKKKKVVTTSDAYLSAINDGWYALTAFDRTIESYFIFHAKSLDILRQSQAASVSYINDPYLGLNAVDMIGPNILVDVSPKSRERFKDMSRQGVTLSDWIDDGRLELLSKTENSLSIQHKVSHFMFQEVARADLNGDTIQDILVFYASSGRRSSWRFYGLLGLTRLQGSDRLTVIPLSN